MEPEAIGAMLDDLRKETVRLENSIADLTVHIGGLSYDDAYAMSFRDRNRLFAALNRKYKAENPDGKDYM